MTSLFWMRDYSEFSTCAPVYTTRGVTSPRRRVDLGQRHDGSAGICCTGSVPTGRNDDNLATLTPLRGISLGDAARRSRQRRPEPALWYVTLTVTGERMRPEEVRAALERLSVEQPFLVSAGYASTRAEIRYWDESVDVEGAVAQALRLWRDHERSAVLPPWRVVGLEVVDRDTARRRWETQAIVQPVTTLGEIRALDGADH
jgi:hypothetical protein